MIGIVVAMQKEANLFLHNANVIKKEVCANKKIFVGNFEEKSFVLIISGIGKTNSAMATQILIDKYDVTKVLNFGTCGGLDEKMQVCDFYTVEKTFFYDYDLSEIDNVNVGYMQDYDLTYFKTQIIKGYKTGVLATGDRFSNKEKDITTIRSLNGNLRDMEGCAVAQVCFSNKKKAYIIKALTDVVGKENNLSNQYLENVKRVCALFPDLLKKIIKKL